MYNTTNGVKPRYDNGGTEFGLMHRDLGPGYWMFDIDRMSAMLEVGLELKRENEAFVEYRCFQEDIVFVAMFEVKKHRTANSETALDSNNFSSMARNALAYRLGCRLFIVFGTNGGQPFSFYEIDTDSGEHWHIGTLSYDQSNRLPRCREFWREVLGITRNDFKGIEE